VIAEFIGGPWDGRVENLPDDRPCWYVPVQPVISYLGVMGTDAFEIPQPLVYHRRGRDLIHGRVVYVLEGLE
jgi:hypothetical protein